MDCTFTIPNGDKAPARWRCTNRDLKEFWMREPGESLGIAWDMWQLSRDTNALPDPFMGTMPDDFHDVGCPPHTDRFRPSLAEAYYAEVAARHPMQYLWVTPGEPPAYLWQIRSELIQRVLLADLVHCKGAARPFYHQIEQDCDGHHYRYMRLMLPVVDDEGEVCRIYAFCRPLTQGFNAEKQKARLI
jgi:hypothetical protein